MSNKRSRASYRQFAGFPFEVLECMNYTRLTVRGKALLLDLRAQFKGSQNGNIVATWTRLSKQDCWNSKETLNYAIQELLHYGFITRVRKGKKIGGKHYPSLYALSWEPIDELPRQGIAPTLTPSHAWHQAKPKWQQPKRKRKRKNPKYTRPYLAPRSQVRTSVLGPLFCFPAPNEVMRVSQVRHTHAQVRHPYTLSKLAIGQGVYLSALSRHVSLGKHTVRADGRRATACLQVAA